MFDVNNLKVGDRFVVVSKPSNVNWGKEMDELCGTTQIIRKSWGDGHYRAMDNPWSWQVKQGHIDIEATRRVNVKIENIE